jgi:lipopolysaccharide transport system ATP-binding protein
MLIKNTIGTEIGGGVTASSPRSSIPFIKQGSVYRVTFRFECILNPGVYFLNAGVIGEINGTEVHLHRLLDIAMFRVIHDSNHFSSGIVDFSIFPEVEEIK